MELVLRVGLAAILVFSVGCNPFEARGRSGGPGPSGPPPDPEPEPCTDPRNVHIAWDHQNLPTARATHYNVYYGAAGPGVYTNAEVAPHPGLSDPFITVEYQQLNLARGAIYYVTVTAENARGESSYSNEISIDLPTCPVLKELMAKNPDYYEPFEYWATNFKLGSPFN